MKELKVLGVLIRDERQKKGLTQRELADAAGVALSALSNLERGRDTTLLTLYKLGRVLGREREIQRWFLRVFAGL